MSLVHYNPWGEMETLQRQMNRLFEDIALPTRRENGRLGFVPAAEIAETDQAILLKLELPGIKAEDLDVQVTKDAVIISGERTEETKSSEEGWTRSEFRYGKFERNIGLPTQVDNTNVSAEYKDGILNLNLPKAEADKNKVVKVNIG